MTDHPTVRIASGIALPSLPQIVQRIDTAIESSDTGTGEIGDLIAQDPTLTAKVLLVANSAMYGLSEQCLSPRHACTILGLQSVRNIVIHAALLYQYEHLKERGFDVSAFWRDAPLVGLAASMLARCVPNASAPRPDEAYLAGLLHDIGQLVLFTNVGEAYVAIQSAAARANEPLEECERREIGMTHAEVGACAIESWGYGERLRDALVDHHEAVTASSQPLTAVVAIADQMVARLNANQFTAAVDAAGAPALAALKISRAQVSDVAETLYGLMHGSHVAAGRIRGPLPSANADVPSRNPSSVRRR
jgi:HD-like signal output (HDOD) protein